MEKHTPIPGAGRYDAVKAQPGSLVAWEQILLGIYGCTVSAFVKQGVS